MYEEISVKRKIDWKSLLIKGSILLVIVFIICAVAFSPRKSYAVTPLNGINQELLKTGKKYYTNELLPTNYSNSKSITLMELVEKELIKAKEYNSNNCDFNQSYVKVSKVNSTEFSISSYLYCNDKEDIIADTILISKDNFKPEDNSNANNNDDNFEIQVIE